MFCKNCNKEVTGKEVQPDIFICPECGCLVENVVEKTEETKTTENPVLQTEIAREIQPTNWISLIFICASFVLSVVALCLLFVAIGDFNLQLDASMGRYIYTYSFAETPLWASVGVNVGGLGCAVMAIVLSVEEKRLAKLLVSALGGLLSVALIISACALLF
jgi:hypothetical protein